jgi:hypothetical protein
MPAVSTRNAALPATPGQVDYIKGLLDGKDLMASPRIFDQCNAMDADEFAQHIESLKDRAATITRASASAWIETLKQLPWKPRERKGPDAPDRGARVSTPDVPAGRYAVETDEGHLAFYRVDRPTEGKWAGYTFVKVYASDELHRLPSRAAADGVLRKIAEVGPETAMKRYGQEIGSCGHCGRTLTDETSRELGIGPVCREKMGF